MSHAVATIKKAFPDLDPNFYDVLLEMAKEQGMTDTRLMDSVKNTIINCQYPTPTVANFLSYDKKIKLYDYSDMLKMHQLDRNVFKIYRPIIIHGQNKPLWAHKCDIENYKKTSSI